MADWDIEIHRQLKMGDRTAFDIWFSVGVERRSFSVAIVDETLERWESNASETFDEDSVVFQLADALLAKGASDMPHEGYLFDEDSASTAQETLEWIGKKGLDHFAAPEEPPEVQV
jgi:hypothetical protein